MDLRRAIKASVSSLSRNKVLTVATVSVIALLLFVSNLLLGLHAIAQKELAQLQERIELTVSLRDDTDPLIVREIIAMLERHPKVVRVRYISKEEALHTLITSSEEAAELFRTYDIKNPLPASVSIVTHDLADHAIVKADLEKTPLGKSIVSLPQVDDISRTMVDRFTTLATTTKRLLLALTLIFMASALLLVENALHLTMFYRRREIEVMRLVGAEPKAIRLPFMLEGFFFGALAWVGMVALLLIFLKTAGKALALTLSFEAGPLMILLGTELLLTIALGMVSSLVALERYLKWNNAHDS